MEIAGLLGVPRQTVDSWRWKGRLPEPDFMVSNRPLWYKATIVQWDKDGRGRKHRPKKQEASK